MPPPGVKARIDRFWRAIKRINQLYSLGLQNFVKNEDALDAGERNLQVAVEALIDVGEALIAKMDWRTPKSYKDIGLILKERNVLNNEQTKFFVDAVKLRNILIHNYIYLPPEKIYENLRKFKKILTLIMDNLIGYMEKMGVDP